MIHYRTFRNADPPALVALWNASLAGRSAAFLSCTTLYEYFVFSKPYFDPAGLIMALRDQTPIGFVQAGFIPQVDREVLDKRQGAICTLIVHPAHRRQGVGSELLQRAEHYLQERGAQTSTVGPQGWQNPFLFGLYGGSQAPGLTGDELESAPFFEHRGYKLLSRVLIFQRPMVRPVNLHDPRMSVWRQRCEIHVSPLKRPGWARECVLGPIELQEFRLIDKANGEFLARLTLWEMSTFAQRWNQQAIGIVDLEVPPEYRRKGLGRFQLAQIIRYLQDQFFNLVEIQVPADNLPAINLVRGVGFDELTAGHSYQRQLSP